MFSALNDFALMKISGVRLALPTPTRAIGPSCKRLERTMKLYNRLRAGHTDIQGEEGATAVEYGLILSLIAVFIMGAVGALGIALDAFFAGVAGAL